jgi:hypothetical protein
MEIMQGLRKEVTGRLRKHCKHLIAMHCAAHKHVLAVQDVARASTLLTLLDAVLKSVYTLFNRKSKMVAVWQLFAKKHGVTAFTFPLFVPTRWFSRAACVRVLVRNYPVLVRFLTVLTKPSSELYWPAAVPVLEMLTRAETVVLLFAVSDILDPLEKARKIFETSGCKLSTVKGEVTVLRERLEILSRSATSIQSFGGDNMKHLMVASKNLHISKGMIILEWQQHEWQVELSTESLRPDMSQQLQELCKALVSSVRFPQHLGYVLAVFRTVIAT